MKKSFCAILLTLLAACQHHVPGLDVTPSPVTEACDTTSVLYYSDIQPVFKANCYECHSTNVTKEGGLDLEDTASLKNYLRQQYHGDGRYGSKLLHIILHSPGVLQMPPTYKIDSCSTNKITRWLNIGGPIG